jgi:hypothetical protein
MAHANYIYNNAVSTADFSYRLVWCGYEGESEMVRKEVAGAVFQIVSSDNIEENLKTGVTTVCCCHDLGWISSCSKCWKPRSGGLRWETWCDNSFH